jgi:hypothetical protein
MITMYNEFRYKTVQSTLCTLLFSLIIGMGEQIKNTSREKKQTVTTKIRNVN